jgi:S-adenosylhomocysteine hydrolase
MSNAIYGVPQETETEIARAMLQSVGISIDEPSEEQKKYGESWAI